MILKALNFANRDTLSDKNRLNISIPGDRNSKEIKLILESVLEVSVLLQKVLPDLHTVVTFKFRRFWGIFWEFRFEEGELSFILFMLGNFACSALVRKSEKKFWDGKELDWKFQLIAKQFRIKVSTLSLKIYIYFSVKSFVINHKSWLIVRIEYVKVLQSDFPIILNQSLEFWKIKNWRFWSSNFHKNGKFGVS